jgi:hypothetical protein
LYDAQDRVENVHVDAGHNYNQKSREAVYRFFGKWLLNDGAKWASYTEPPYTLETTEALRVFPDKKLPDGLPTADQIIAQTIESTKAKWQAVMPRSKDGAAAFRDQYGDVLGLVLGTTLPKANDLAPERAGFEEKKDKGYVIERWVLHRRCVNDAVPAILYRAADPKPCDAVLIVHGQGKAALADVEGGGPGPLVAGLLAQGKAVMVIDTFLLGEHNAPQARATRRQVGEFMDTFQPTDTGYRIQDVLTALSYLRFRRDLTGTIDLVGVENGGMWCLFASALDGKVRKTVIDGNQFDATDDNAWTEKFYVPCLRSVGDVATAAALIAPRDFVLMNAAPSFAQPVTDSYNAVKADTLKVEAGVASPETLIIALH